MPLGCSSCHSPLTVLSACSCRSKRQTSETTLATSVTRELAMPPKTIIEAVAGKMCSALSWTSTQVCDERGSGALGAYSSPVICDHGASWKWKLHASPRVESELVALLRLSAAAINNHAAGEDDGAVRIATRRRVAVVALPAADLGSSGEQERFNRAAAAISPRRTRLDGRGGAASGWVVVSAPHLAPLYSGPVLASQRGSGRPARRPPLPPPTADSHSSPSRSRSRTAAMGKKDMRSSINSHMSKRKEEAAAASSSIDPSTAAMAKMIAGTCMHPECLVRQRAEDRAMGLDVAEPKAEPPVNMICTFKECGAGTTMHAECFAKMEASMHRQLETRSDFTKFSSVKRQYSLWRDKYDLVQQLCRCACQKGYLKPAYLENGDDQEAMEREEKKKKLEAKLAADAKRKEEEAKKVREEKKRELEQKAEQKKARKEELKQREALGLPRSSKPRAETTAWTEVGSSSSSSAAGGSSSSYPYTGGGYAASSSLPWQSDGSDYGFQFPLPPPPSFSGAAASSSMHGGGLAAAAHAQPPRPPPPEFNLERQQAPSRARRRHVSVSRLPRALEPAARMSSPITCRPTRWKSVCLEPLAGVRLECSHTICGGCLKDWASVLTSYAATARKGSSAVTCPICRQSTEVAHKIAQSSPPVQFAYTPAQQLGGGGAPRAHVPAHAPPSTAAAVAARRAGASSSSSSSAAGAPAATSAAGRVRHITGRAPRCSRCSRCRTQISGGSPRSSAAGCDHSGDLARERLPSAHPDGGDHRAERTGTDDRADGDARPAASRRI